MFALIISTDIIEALRYKLRCFGIPVEGPAEVFFDKMLVIKNSSIPTSALYKRKNTICYHRGKEARAEGILWVGCITGEFNLDDFFTKTTMHGNTRHDMVGSIFSNTVSPIGDIEKAWVHLNMGSSNYLPHYKSIHGKFVLGLHIYNIFDRINDIL